MSIRLTRDGSVARLIIDRAERRNAMTVAMFESVPALVAEAASARVLVLTSATPGMFCAGADIGELQANAHDPDWVAVNQRAINAAQAALAAADVPTVAVIDGDCVGGGCGLALACDLRIATPRARFGITPAKLGLVYPLHDTRLLVDLVGPGQAKRLLYTGMLIDAAEALRIGLIEELAADADAIAAAIAATSPWSVRETKRIVARIARGQADDDDATRATFRAAFDGADFHEGVAAFGAKRKPEFKG